MVCFCVWYVVVSFFCFLLAQELGFVVFVFCLEHEPVGTVASVRMQAAASNAALKNARAGQLKKNQIQLKMKQIQHSKSIWVFYLN